MASGESRSAESRSPYGSSRGASPQSRSYGSADAATAAILDRRLTCGSRSSPRALMEEAHTAGAHRVTVAGVRLRASAVTPRPAVTAADRRTAAAVGTVVAAATVDMGGKTTPGPLPA